MCEEGLHDPFEDQVACARYRAERDALAHRMEEVASEIDRTLLGVEGIEDAPAMRWARGLREALGALHSPRTSYEDIEAARWVRERGGLDAVKRRWECLSYYADPVPRSCMEKRLARLQRQIDESHAALRRRNQRIEELTHRASDLTRENAELRKRAMPESYEWPRYESGEPVRIGDVVSDVEVRSVVFRDGGILLSDCTSVPGWGTWRSYKEPIRRLAVPASDGEPLEVGQTVWDTNGDELVVGALEDGGHTVTCRYADVGDSIPVHGMWSPSDLTHQRPVLDADGVPIKEGDTVWCVATDGELADMSIFRACWSKMREKLTVKSFLTDAHGDKWADFEETPLCAKTCYLTHTKPEPSDSWGALWDDIEDCAVGYESFMRRCRALAERERGE